LRTTAFFAGNDFFAGRAFFSAGFPIFLTLALLTTTVFFATVFFVVFFAGFLEGATVFFAAVFFFVTDFFCAIRPSCSNLSFYQQAISVSIINKRSVFIKSDDRLGSSNAADVRVQDRAMTEEKKEDGLDETVELPVDGVLDLHTFAPRDVGNLLPHFFSLCREKGIYEVRIIHGKGSGMLREKVHSILKRLPEVLSFRLAGGDAGEWGATIVRLRPFDKKPGAESGPAPGSTIT
jgi:hypothetical protein